MSKEAIRKIKEAETEAEQILRQAREESARILSLSEKKGMALCESADSEMMEEARSTLLKVKKKTSDYLASTEIRAKEEAEELSQAASGKLRLAVKSIMWGIQQNVSQ